MAEFTYQFVLKSREIVINFVNVPADGYDDLIYNLTISDGSTQELVDEITKMEIDGGVHFIGDLINHAIRWKIMLKNIKADVPNCSKIRFTVDWMSLKILEYTEYL